MTFAFTPSDGYRNTTSFPTKPANEAAFRDSMQDLLDQLRDYLNGAATFPSLISFLGGINVQVSSVPSGVVGNLYTNGATGSLNYRDLTADQVVWHNGLAPVSLAVNGYQKLPSELIIQWGKVNVPAGGFVAFAYPIAFPTAVYSVVGTTNSTTLCMTNVAFVGNTTAQLGQSDSTARDVYWIAIGR